MVQFSDFLVPEEEDNGKAEDLNWQWLCMPRLPFSKPSDPPPFYRVNQIIPWSVAIVMGFQHALAMLGGIVSVPLLLGGPFDAKLSAGEVEYLVSAGLIVSGLLSFINITQFKLPYGYYLGTGMISVLGTSFTFVPIARTSMAFIMDTDSGTSCASDFDCKDAWAGFGGNVEPGVTNGGQCNLNTGFCKYSGQYAYGAFLGTAALCSILEVILSFLPISVLKRTFPPIVTGTCVLLIGVGLTGTGIKYWGGGAFCADNAHKRYHITSGPDMMGDWTGNYSAVSPSPCYPGPFCPKALSGVCMYSGPTYDMDTNMTKGDRTTCETFKDLPGVFPANSAVGNSVTKCTNNGEVILPYGSPEYVALGFAVFGMLLVIEMFGSPFMRNCEVAVALLFGFFVAAVASYEDSSGESLRYVTDDRIKAAPGITFLWVNTFPLSVYGPAVFPMLLGFVITLVETVGDITAAAEASRIETMGDRFEGRVQGGLLSDGFCSILSVLMTSAPNTTFSQNSGVIALTRCANKRAGYMCCVFLVLFGILAKISAIIASIPDCVLGGMTTFLFVNVLVSGLRVVGPALHNRRDRFIVAASLALGVGVAIVPHWATNALIAPGGSEADEMAKDGIRIVLSTPYCIGTLVALLLNAVIPEDKEEEGESETDDIPVVEPDQKPDQSTTSATAQYLPQPPVMGGPPAGALGQMPGLMAPPADPNMGQYPPMMPVQPGMMMPAQQMYPSVPAPGMQFGQA